MDGIPVPGWADCVVPCDGELVFSVPESCAGRSSGRGAVLVGLSVWAGRSSPGFWFGADGVFWEPWSGRSSGVVPGAVEVG